MARGWRSAASCPALCSEELLAVSCALFGPLYSPTCTCSHKAAGKRPTKRLKCERNSLMKSGLEGCMCGGENLPAPEAPAEGSTSEGDVSSKPCAAKSRSAPSKTESSENLQDRACREEESSCESLLLEGTGLKDGDIPKKLTELDNSAFLDDDSNQPMPVDRFFGNIDFMQDQLAAVLPSTAMSRREYRRLHFIAKEDEEEDEDAL
uniref:Chromosome 1 open reading frame 174 n=1 Tax=Phasianus colchicus TaxID=9054 RepID=A0A669QZN7_PHACC